MSFASTPVRDIASPLFQFETNPDQEALAGLAIFQSWRAGSSDAGT
jgi:hypothetical protein